MDDIKPALGVPIVAAVIVTNGLTEYFPGLVDSILKSETTPNAIYVTDVSSGDTALATLIEQANQQLVQSKLRLSISLVLAKGSKSFGDAVNKVIADPFFRSDIEWLWTLHDDTIVHPNALKAQLFDAESSELIGVVGAKPIDPKTKFLQNAGYTTTKTGIRVPLVGKGEVDQNQYDYREDVYTVSINGALISLPLWKVLKGTNRALSIYNDSIDFCRRVHLNGRRVVICDNANVEHFRRELSQNSHLKQMRLQTKSDVIYKLGIVPLIAYIPAILYILALTIIKPIQQLYSSHKGALAIFLGNISGLFSGIKIIKTRRLMAKSRIKGVHRSSLKPLLATHKDLTLLRRDQKMQEAGELWSSYQPGLLDIPKLKTLAKKRRIAFTGVCVLLLAITAVHFFADFGTIIGGGHFIGASLKSSNSGFWETFTEATSGYNNTGFGVSSPVDAFMIPLSALSLIFAGLTGSLTGSLAGSVAGSVSTMYALNFLVLTAILLAGIFAWFGAGAATRNNSARAIAALVWVCLPNFTSALGDGNLYAVYAHVLLPLLFLFIARGLGMAATDLSIGAPPLKFYFALTGVILALITATSPAVLIVSIVLFIGAGFFNRRFLFALIPTLVLNSWILIWALMEIGNNSLAIFVGNLSPLFSVIFGVVLFALLKTQLENSAFKISHVAVYTVVIALLASLFAFQFINRSHSSLRAVADYEIPAIAGKIAREKDDQGNTSRILILTLDGDNNVSYNILNNRSNDFIHNSEAQKALNSDAQKGSISNGQISENEQKLRKTISLAISSPNFTASQSFRELGIGAIYVPDDAVNVGVHSGLLSTLDSTPGLGRLIDGQAQALWRVQADTPITFDNSGYLDAIQNPLRYIQIITLLLCFFVYLILCIPAGKRRVIKYEI